MNYCSLELFKKPITDEIFEDEKKYDKKIQSSCISVVTGFELWNIEILEH